MALLSEDTYNGTGKTDKTYKEFIADLGEKYIASDKRKEIEFDTTLPELNREYVDKRKYAATVWTQFGILYRRATVNNARQIADNVARICSTIMFSLFLLALYINVWNFLVIVIDS